MSRVCDGRAPYYVWADELVGLLERARARAGLSKAGLATIAAERGGIDRESAERRLRSIGASSTVVHVHVADLYLTVLGLHLTDVPSYSRALEGVDPPSVWPRRGVTRAEVDALGRSA